MIVPVSPRAVPIDLSLLQPPTIIEPLDPDALVLAWIADLKAKLPTWSGVFDQDPFVKACYVWAEALTRKTERDNQRCNAVFLALATGADLDHLAATYYADLGLRRLVMTPANDAAIPPVPAVMESDTRFRERIRLAPEAYAGTGTEGGYRFWAMTAEPTLIDVRLGVSEDVERRLTIVLLAPPSADRDLVAHRVLSLVRANKPATDVVSVTFAKARPYAIRGILEYGAGADPETITSRARQNCTAIADYAAARIGSPVNTDALIAGLRVPGVAKAILEAPTEDLRPAFDTIMVCSSIDLMTRRHDV